MDAESALGCCPFACGPLSARRRPGIRRDYKGGARRSSVLPARCRQPNNWSHLKIGALPEPFEGDGYAFLATIYKDKQQPIGVRMDAAKTAIAYERPRLSNVEMTTRSLDRLTDEDFFRAWDSVARFLAERGRPKLLEMTAGSLDEEPAVAVLG
jgi:hypothetical protein